MTGAIKDILDDSQPTTPLTDRAPIRPICGLLSGRRPTGVMTLRDSQGSRLEASCGQLTAPAAPGR
jgi:hypothetical protein